MSLDQAAYNTVDIDIRRKIEKVVFRFTSRDQGWEEESGSKGRLLTTW